MFSISRFNEKGLPYQFVSEDKVSLFAQKTPKITPQWTSYYPIFLCYAQHLSYLWNKPEEKDLTFRVAKFESLENEILISSCVGSSLFIAHKILHTEEIDFNIEAGETACSVSLTQFLFNQIGLETSGPASRNTLTSLNCKANQTRNLFSEIILGLKPLITTRFLQEPIAISSLEKTLESHLQGDNKLVAIAINSSNISSISHAIFFLSDMNKHFMIDINMPIIQFSSKGSLLKWAPKIVRTFYSKTDEIPTKHLSCGFKNALKKGVINYSVKEIEGLYVFQKVKYQNPSFTRKRELIEYTKAIWQLPYEKGVVKLEDDLGRIKIQRIICLINKTIQFKDQFQAPLYLSPLTAKGTKVKIIETLTHRPVESDDQSDRFTGSIIDEIDLIEEEMSNAQDLLVKVFNILKVKFDANKTKSEWGFVVSQFRFGEELEKEDIPLLCDIALITTPKGYCTKQSIIKKN